MEDRFIDLGCELAVETASMEGFTCDTEFIDWCQQYCWLHFVADCSDDYC